MKKIVYELIVIAILTFFIAWLLTPYLECDPYNLAVIIAFFFRTLDAILDELSAIRKLLESYKA